MNENELLKEKRKSLITWLIMLYISEIIIIFKSQIKAIDFIFSEISSVVLMVTLFLLLPVYTIYVVYIYFRYRTNNLSSGKIFPKNLTLAAAFLSIVLTIIAFIKLSQF